MAGERGDSEENHSDSQDLYHTSLHSDTVSSGPYVEAVLPKDEMNWLWFSYFKQNAVLRLSSPPAPKAWQNLYLGRRIVMELGGSSGNWGAAQLCLRQIQFFFFFWQVDPGAQLWQFPPFAFSFPLLCCVIPISFLPKHWVVGLWPRNGLSVHLPVLAFLTPAERRKWSTLACEPWSCFPLPPIH